MITKHKYFHPFIHFFFALLLAVLPFGGTVGAATYRVYAKFVGYTLPDDDNKPHCYRFTSGDISSGWPGEEMTRVTEANTSWFTGKEGEWWYYEIIDGSGSYGNVIFSFGGKQTVDLAGSSGTSYYTVFTVDDEDSTKWDTYYHESSPTAKPSVSYYDAQFYIYGGGLINGVDANWQIGSLNDAAHKFVCQGNGIYTLTINKTSGERWFRLYSKDPSKTRQYGAKGNPTEPADGRESYFYKANITDGYCWKINFNEDYEYTLTLYFDNEQWKRGSYLKLTRALYHAPTKERGENYYWVSPQVTGGRMLNQFKLVADRARNGGPISQHHFTVNFKKDHLKYYDDTYGTKGTLIPDGTAYDWYIVNADNGRTYRPPTDCDKTMPASNQDKNGKTYTHIVSGTLCTDDSNTRMFSRTNYDTDVSYTVFLNTDGEVRLNVNKTMDDKGCYYLIGNFKDANATANIQPQKTDGRKKMKRYYFTGGSSTPIELADNATVPAGADSVVYRVEVTRPDAGWGELYIDVAPEMSNVGMNWSDFSSNPTEAWKKVIRPQVQDSEVSHDMDGRALEGGLIENLKGDDSWLQSLNPAVDPFLYTSYEFSMNVTYSTYRLIFKTDIYLVGDAVTAFDEYETQLAGGSFNLEATGNNQPIQLTYDDSDGEGCYKWAQNDGKIHITNHEEQGMPEFRFVVNKASYKVTFSEDGSAPQSPFYEDAPYVVNGVVDVNGATLGGDTQFRNKLFYHSDGSTSTTDPQAGLTDEYNKTNQNCRLYLPTGDYVLRFYIKEVVVDGKSQNMFYYTLDHDLPMTDMAEVYYNGSKRTVTSLGGYRYFTTWSDYLAYEKPEGVDVFVVTDFTAASANSYASAELKNISDQGILPARTGLVLAAKESEVSGKGYAYDAADVSGTSTGVLRPRLKVFAEDPEKTYDDTSLMLKAYQPTALEQLQDDGRANYLLGAYCANPTDAATDEYLMGFWVSNGTRRTHANTAYLQLDGQTADDLNIGTSYGQTSGGPLKAPVLLLDFGDGSTPTALKTLSTNHSTLNTGAWYTLQGQRFQSAPTRPGLYIHGGRKVVIK